MDDDRFWMKSWRTAKRTAVIAAALAACASAAVAAPPVIVTDPGGVNQQTVAANGQASVNALTGYTNTNASGTVTTGATFQTVLASNANRHGCLIQNPQSATETLFVYFGPNGSATTAASVSLAAGAGVSCAIGGDGVATDNVSVTATTTGHAFVATSQ